MRSHYDDDDEKYDYDGDEHATTFMLLSVYLYDTTYYSQVY